MWYPFYYNADLSKSGPLGRFLAITLCIIPCLIVTYTVLWLFPAVFSNSVNFESWGTGLLICGGLFLGYFVWMFLVSFLGRKSDGVVEMMNAKPGELDLSKLDKK